MRSLTWKLTLFLSLLQAVICVIVFLCFREYSVKFQLGTWLALELSQADQHFISHFEVLGYNIGYFFTAKEDELAIYYPRLFRAIYYSGRIIKYGLPIFGMILIILSKPMRLLYAWAASAYSELDMGSFIAKLLPVLAALVVSIVFYFSFRGEVFDSFNFQLYLTRSFLLVALAHLLGLLITQFSYVKNATAEFLLAASAPHSLAVFRILFFGYMAFMYVVAFPNWGGMFIGQMEIVPPLYTAWFWNNIPIEIDLYHGVCYLSALVAALVAIGFQTRPLLILHAFLCFYVITMPNVFGKIWHIQIMIWISWIMAVSPCADVLSVDRLLKPGTSSEPYNFFLKMIWFHFGLIYFFAGFHKLWTSGFDWALTDSMVNQLRLEWFEHYDKVPSFRVDRYPVFLKLSGMLVIIFELVFWLMIGVRKLRFVAVLAGLIMHRAIEKFLYISFFSVLEVFYVAFIPWNKLFQKAGLVKKQDYDFRFPFRWKVKYVWPILILICNFCFGVFKINSFPFSVYPVYSSVVPDTVKYFNFVPVDQDLNVWNQGERSGFRWENFTRDQYDVISRWESSGKLDTSRVYHHWNLWKKGVPTLNHIDTVDVFLIQSPLNPDERFNRSETFVMRIENLSS